MSIQTYERSALALAALRVDERALATLDRRTYIVSPLTHPRMRSKIVRIGNSQGVRLPKLMIEQAGLGEDVELRVEGGQIVIATPRNARAGWAEAAQHAHAAGDDQLESSGATRFDATKWKWR
jgi:antitoxin MazE